MNTAVVKWFSARKGYGFLFVPGVPEDVFVHHTAIVTVGYRELFDGQAVECEVDRDEKGLRATNVIPGPLPAGARPRFADEKKPKHLKR